MSLATMTKDARAAFLPCEIDDALPMYHYGPMAFHHRKLRSAGGSDDRANLRWLCQAHHAYIHANPEISYERGWLVHSYEVKTGVEQ